MAKHTEGEWEAIPPKKVGKHWSIGVKGTLGGKGVTWLLAHIDNGKPGDTLDTEQANALLMAAAPDLLDALRGMLLSQDCSWENLNLGHDWREACEHARAAIRKAKGE
jgi:hypothetical protein